MKILLLVAALFLETAWAEESAPQVPPGGEDDFGFSPPPEIGGGAEPRSNPTPAPVPSLRNHSRATPPPVVNTPLPQAPRVQSTPSFPQRRASAPAEIPSSGKKAIQKAAPKLADYLELDPSVKGLEVKNFDLPDKDIRDVVTMISKWTGKNFILDSKVRGKITIIGPSQVSLQEAYQAFLSALEANGLTTIQNGKYIRIIESAEARRAPVKTYAGDYAPKDDQFITRVFQLKYINADEVQREFRDLTTRQGKLFAYEPTNSIIITDTGSNIQRIKELLEVLDVKSFETTLHVLKIKNTSAKVISDMLGEIYGDPKKGGTQSRSFQRSSLERTRGGGIITKIIPDEQTNSLVVLANAAGFRSLKELADKLDVKVTDTGKIHVYYCEYAKAEDLAQTLASLAGGGGGAGARTSRTSSQNRSAGGNAITSAGFGGQGGAAAPSRGGTTADLGDGVKVTADPPTNSLVIIANAAEYQTIKKVIKKLDIPRLQVFVETAILEIQLSSENNWGVDAGIVTNSGKFAGGFVTSDPKTLIGELASGQPQSAGASIPIFSPPFGISPLAPGGASQSANFLGIIRFLTTLGNTSILSTPQIIALDNEKATFQAQDKIPVVDGVTPTVASTGQTTTNAFNVPNIQTSRLPQGVDISLTPHVNATTKTIRLEIEQTVESVSSAGVPKQLADFQRTQTTRKTNTQVVVKHNDYVALGGLIADKVEEIEKKVPLLGDIPILGWLFKARDKRVSKTNLIILLHPRIIGTSLDSAKLVDEKLTKRDQFIEKHYGGDERHEEEVAELKAKVQEQMERGAKSGESIERSNEEDEEEKEDPKKDKG